MRQGVERLLFETLFKCRIMIGWNEVNCAIPRQSEAWPGDDMAWAGCHNYRGRRLDGTVISARAAARTQLSLSSGPPPPPAALNFFVTDQPLAELVGLGQYIDQLQAAGPPGWVPRRGGPREGISHEQASSQDDIDGRKRVREPGGSQGNRVMAGNSHDCTV